MIHTDENLSKQLLDYCNKLYQRELHAQQISGATKWALCIAIVYVTWEMIPSFAKYINDQGFIKDVAFLFAHMVFSIPIFLIAMLPSGKIRSSKFDLRLNKIDAPVVKGACLVLLLPVSSSLYAVYVGGTESFQVYTLFANCILVGFSLLSLLFLIAAENFFGDSAAGLNTAVSGASTNNKVSWFFNGFTILLAVVNLFYVFQVVESVQAEGKYREDVLFFSLNMIILFVVFIGLMAQVRNVKMLKMLESLERDLQFQSINTEEAKKRLDESYLGIYVGDWLQEKLEDINDDYVELVEMLEGVDELVGEIKEIDSEMQYEKEGRIRKYYEKLNDVAESYEKKTMTTLSWLEIKLNQYSGDLVFQEVVKPIQSKLRENTKKLKQRNTAASEKIEEIFPKGD